MLLNDFMMDILVVSVVLYSVSDSSTMDSSLVVCGGFGSK